MANKSDDIELTDRGSSSTSTSCPIHSPAHQANNPAPDTTATTSTTHKDNSTNNPDPLDTLASELSPLLAAAADIDPTPASSAAPEWRVAHLFRRSPSAPTTLDTLPTELLWLIAEYLDVVTISRLQQVNKHLNAVIDDATVWRPLYQSVFRYDEPLTHRAGDAFYEFQPAAESPLPNPWRHSFRLLFGAVHVRKGYEERRCRGGRRYFKTLALALNITRVVSDGVKPRHNTDKGEKAAISLLNGITLQHKRENRHLPHDAMIILHAGDHPIKETQTIDWPVAIIGAAPGPPAGIGAQVRILNSHVMQRLLRFVEGSGAAYCGHLSLRMRMLEGAAQYVHVRCVSVRKSCTPTIDWCRLSGQPGITELICVLGPGAAPLVRECHLQTARPEAPDFDKDNIVYGVLVGNGAGGVYAYNSISYINVLGAQIELRHRVPGKECGKNVFVNYSLCNRPTQIVIHVDGKAPFKFIE